MMTAPPRTHTYFLSDLHLGAHYFMDPREQERMVCDWLREIEPTARRLYLVGDVLDYWYEYRHVVPRGYVRFLGTLAYLADRGVEITWVIGNHDIWIFDYLPSEIGLRVVDGVLREEIDGRRFVIAHGDGLGPVARKDRLMRATFRNRLLQKLYAAIHPRWTVGFAFGWSAHNRRKHHTGYNARPYTPEPLMAWVREQQEATPGAERPDYYIFGHYHCLTDREVEGSRVIILGDWIQLMSYADFHNGALTLKRHDAPRPRHSLCKS